MAQRKKSKWTREVNFGPINEQHRTEKEPAQERLVSHSESGFGISPTRVTGESLMRVIMFESWSGIFHRIGNEMPGRMIEKDHSPVSLSMQFFQTASEFLGNIYQAGTRLSFKKKLYSAGGGGWGGLYNIL